MKPKLQNFMPLYLIWSSKIAGVFPFKGNESSMNVLLGLYSLFLIIIGSILTVAITYVVLCSTCEGVAVHMKSTLWSYLLKIVHPSVRVIANVPSYIVALVLLRNYIFDIINNIHISDSIIHYKNESIKKNHFLSINLHLLLFAVVVIPQKIKIVSSVLYEGEFLKIMLFLSAYFGDISMICVELQFICFCYCFYYRFKWINDYLNYLLKLVNSTELNSSHVGPKKLLNIDSFTDSNCKLYNLYKESHSSKITKQILRRKNLTTTLQQPSNSLRRVAVCENPVDNVSQQSDESHFRSIFKSDFRQVMKTNNQVHFKVATTGHLKNCFELTTEISQLRTAHRFLCKAMSDLELMYSLQIITSVSALFTMLIFHTYFEFLHFNQHGMSYIAYSRFLTLVHLSQFFTRLYVIFTEPHYAVDEAYAAESIITVLDNQRLDSNARFELKIFLNDLRSKDLNFTAWGFFPLKPYVLTLAIGAVVTYLTVLVQFSNK